MTAFDVAGMPAIVVAVCTRWYRGEDGVRSRWFVVMPSRWLLEESTARGLTRDRTIGRERDEDDDEDEGHIFVIYI